MTVSRLVRWMLVACAAVWIIAPRPAPIGLAQSSPLQSPLPDPFGNPFASPVPTPHVDPAECTAATPCGPVTPTPGEFKAFVPGVSEAGGAAPSAPVTPPDLGTLLNYVAAGVIVFGGALKVYWLVSDRRQAKQAASTNEPRAGE